MNVALISESNQGKLFRTLKLLPILILFLYLLLSALSFKTADKRELINAFDDDAYLYFNIAKNFSETGRMTFDGKSTTNGFHPLWMIVLILFYFILNDSIMFLRAIGIFSVLLVGIMGYISLYYLYRYSLLSYFLASTLLITSIISFGLIGMEVTLLLPLLLIALVWMAQTKPWLSKPTTQAKMLALGFILSLIQLARLDAVFLVATILLIMAIILEPKKRKKNVIILGIFPLLTGLIYLLVNYVVFNHFIPTSGVVKSLASSTLWFNSKFIAQLTTPNNPVDGNIWIVYLFLLIISMGYLSLMAFIKFKSGINTIYLEDIVPVIVAIFFIVFSAYQIFRTSWVLWRWYAYPIIPISIFLVPEIISRIESRLYSHSHTRIYLLVISAFIIPLLTIYICILGIRFGNWSRLPKASFQYENYLIADALNHEATDPKIFAIGDRAGTFAYFYQGDVLQLEGLVGDFQFIQALQSNQVVEYMTEFGVQYVMSYIAPVTDYSRWTMSTPLPSLSLGPYADIILCKQTELKRVETQYSIYTIWIWPSCDSD